MPPGRGAARALALAIAAIGCGVAPPPGPVCARGGGRDARAQCGPTLDFTPINRYAGELALAQLREEAVVLIGGTCTGTLIAAAAGPVVLTAGHCTSAGEQLVVAFNVEAEADGPTLVTSATVFERSDAPDYALLRLDQLPAIAPTPLAAEPTARLAIIQHPRGGPKVIAEGTYAATCDRELVYRDLDTLVGSSGAGVLRWDGGLVAVHADGDCTASGGTNRGPSAAAIVDASPYLGPGDLGGAAAR